MPTQPPGSQPAVSTGVAELRNRTDAVELFDLDLGLRRAAGSTEPGVPHVGRPSASRGRLRPNDEHFWFCSLDCAAPFAACCVMYGAVS